MLSSHSVSFLDLGEVSVDLDDVRADLGDVSVDLGDVSVQATAFSSTASTYGKSPGWTAFILFLLPKPPLLSPSSLSFLFTSSFPWAPPTGLSSPALPPPTLKSTGNDRLVEGSRIDLDVGRAGSAGGKSFGFSSLFRSESSISSSELRTTVGDDTDNIVAETKKIHSQKQNKT